MIEYGHRHYFQPVARHPLPNGGQQLLRICVCGMEERRTFLPDDDHPYELTFRFNGMWIQPVDLLRLLPVPVELCPACEGECSVALDTCATCGGLGVVEDGARLGMPELAMRR